MFTSEYFFFSLLIYAGGRDIMLVMIDYFLGNH